MSRQWGHWKNPVIYMSRTTAREVWQLFYGTEPDLHGDLRYGQSQIPVLFDDRMPFGEARLEEDPEESPANRAEQPAPPLPDHLIGTHSGRGFLRLPAISAASAFGGGVEVYESSAASGPHLWLKVTENTRPDAGAQTAHAHLSAESAWQLADQLRHAVRNHYQGDAVPEGARDADPEASQATHTTQEEPS